MNAATMAETVAYLHAQGHHMASMKRLCMLRLCTAQRAAALEVEPMVQAGVATPRS